MRIYYTRRRLSQAAAPASTPGPSAYVSALSVAAVPLPAAVLNGTRTVSLFFPNFPPLRSSFPLFVFSPPPFLDLCVNIFLRPTAGT